MNNMDRNINLENNRNLEINKNIELEKKQNKFLNSSIAKVLNIGLDVGIRAIMPDLIEDQIINIKNTLLSNGIKAGAKKAVDETQQLVKSTKNIITGNFESVEEAHVALKRGGLMDKISSSLSYAISEGQRKGLIDRNVARILRAGKENLMYSINDKLEDKFEQQIKSVQNVEKYIKNWERFYSEHNLEGMENELYKIKREKKNLLPLEKVIKNTEKIEDINTLIKNRNGNFNLTEVERNLTKLLI